MIAIAADIGASHVFISRVPENNTPRGIQIAVLIG
jgi:hypothetical protein